MKKTSFSIEDIDRYAKECKTSLTVWGRMDDEKICFLLIFRLKRHISMNDTIEKFKEVYGMPISDGTIRRYVEKHKNDPKFIKLCKLDVRQDRM